MRASLAVLGTSRSEDARPVLVDGARWLAIFLACAAVGLATGFSPRLGLGVALGVAYLLIAVLNLTWGLFAFVLITFLDLEKFEYGSLTFSRLFGVLLVAAWLFNFLTHERRPDNDLFTAHPGFLVWLLLFLVWAGMSALWAEDTGPVITAVERFGLNMILIPVVFSAVREQQHALGLLWSFVIGALASTAYGVIFRAELVDVSENRLSGSAGDPNFTAMVLVAAIVLCVGLLGTSGRYSRLSWPAVVAGVLAYAGLLKTHSRTGLSALAATLVVGSIVGGRWRKYAMTLVVLTAAASFSYIMAFAPSAAKTHLVSADSTGRSDLWTVAKRMVDDHPVRGIGAGNFPVSSVDYLLRPGPTTRADFIVDTPLVAHNIYLEQLAELGIVGLLLFLAIPLLSLRYSLAAARILAEKDMPSLELAARATTVALVGVMAAGFIISAQFSKQLWLLIAIGPAWLNIARARATQ